MKKLLLIASAVLSVEVSAILPREEFEKRFIEHQKEYVSRLESLNAKLGKASSSPDFINKLNECCRRKKFTNATSTNPALLDEDIVNPIGRDVCIETAIFEILKNEEDFDLTDFLYINKLRTMTFIERTNPKPL